MNETSRDGLSALSDSHIIAEFSHQDSLLQAYRQQFLVAETFTAAVAATTVFSNPTIALALTLLGIVILVGWILVTRSRARVLYYWDKKLRVLRGFREVFDRRELEPSATMWARFWLGGDPIGVFQLAFGVFWAFLMFVALGGGALVLSGQLADLGVHRRPGSQEVTCRMKWTGWDLNPRPLPCQDSDLPADLPARDARYPGPSIKVSLRVAAGSFSS